MGHVSAVAEFTRHNSLGGCRRGLYEVDSTLLLLDLRKAVIVR